MARSRFLATLRQAVRKDMRKGKLKQVLEGHGLNEWKKTKRRGIFGLQSVKLTAKEHNTMVNLLEYDGEDSKIKHAQKCFQNNLMKGLGKDKAYSECGLGFGYRDEAWGERTGGKEKRRYGVTGLKERKTPII